MIFHISLDNKSARFLDSGDLKVWTSAEDRGFADDGAAYTDDDTKMNRAAKAALLNIVLGSIASYAPVISHRFVKQQSTSFNSIWNRLRSYYGFRKTGARILELTDFHLEQNESREALWERLYTFMEDNLLTKSGGVKHEDVKQETDEVFTPTLLNVLVSCWLNIISPALPSLIRQRFSTQLREKTVFSIREEISDAIPILLEEVENREGLISRTYEGVVNRSGGFRKGRSAGNYESKRRKGHFNSNKRKCCLCEASGRQSSNHYLSSCPFLPSDDKRFLARGREVILGEEDDDQDNEESLVEESFKPTIGIVDVIPKQGSHSYEYTEGYINYESEDPSSGQVSDACSKRVDVIPSPVIRVSVRGKQSDITADCGAEADLIAEEEARRLDIEIMPTKQRAKMADGKSQLHIVGEAHFSARRGHHVLEFKGLVVRHLDTPILAGMPFLLRNDISINYRTNTISLGSCCKVVYSGVKVSRSRSGASVLRVSGQTCILPGEEVAFQLPKEVCNGEPVALEPRTTVPSDMPEWIDCKILTPNSDGCITLQNTSMEPILLSKHTQICQVRPTLEVDIVAEVASTKATGVSKGIGEPLKSKSCNTLNTIKVDPANILSKSEKSKFDVVHKKYESVFSSGIGCYNGHAGKFSHVINLGEKLPPQRKGRIPIYNRGDMEKLQEKFDELLDAGVLARAEDVGVPVEYVHPSFLVKKSSGGYRLVTSFGEMAEYARPQPTGTSNVEHVLLQVGQWKYIIKADLKSAYYQILLSPESSKFAGVMTPYKGTLVYLRSVMGLPGSEAALEEVLSRIFGGLMKEGKVAKLADDLYVGAETVEELLTTWDEVLRRLLLNGLKLKPDKTECCPVSTIILGWQWENGSLRPTSHKMNALAACEPPETVKSLRSYIGCYKFLSRVLPCYAEVLHPLEEFCGGKASSDKIVWTDDLLAAFNISKTNLRKAKPVVLPRYDDQLHIVTDASNTGLGAALFVVRRDKPVLAGYFNAKLRKGQDKLLPCELEALAIGASLKHYSYYISQSLKRTRVITDSRPCVLAYKKLSKGEFSASPRVTTFLSLANRYGVEIMHIAGKDNLFSDYLSRNPIECQSADCQICKFIQNTSVASVGEVKVSDILSGAKKVPFTTETSWIPVQRDCPDLNKVYKYISTGASMSKNKKGMTDVRRYLSCGVVISKRKTRELLVVLQPELFKSSTERIVIPRRISQGLITALHLQLCHPSAYQLKQVFCRAYFCLDLDSIARTVVEGCHTCAALKKMPAIYHKQSTSEAVKVVGCKYSADVVRRSNQCILLIREDISSFTDATFVNNEQADTLRDGIIVIMSRLRSPLGPKATIRTDPATALRSLVNDRCLSGLNLEIELGEPKNVNKNPIAEKGIQELEAEFVRLKPLGGKVSEALLAQAVSNLNSRIRQNKLSSFEVWNRREMTTGNPLSLSDKELIDLKQQQRESHHHSSAKYKARGKDQEVKAEVTIGDIVYLYIDKSKLRSREKYMVTKVTGDDVFVQKLTSNQLRGRVYKVKRTDIITVTKAEATPGTRSEAGEDSKPVCTGKQSNIVSFPRKVKEIHNQKDLTSPDIGYGVESDSEDEYYEISSFLPRTLSQIDNHDAQAQMQEDSHESTDQQSDDPEVVVESENTSGDEVNAETAEEPAGGETSGDEVNAEDVREPNVGDNVLQDTVAADADELSDHSVGNHLEQQEPEQVGRSVRNKQVPSYLQDYVLGDGVVAAGAIKKKTKKSKKTKKT